MSKVLLGYDQRRYDSIETLYDTLGKLLELRELHPVKIRQWVRQANNSYDFIYKMEADPVVLEQVVDEFLRQTGIPDFVYNGSDYSLVDRVLLKYNKKTKRKSGGAWVGRHIVDL